MGNSKDNKFIDSINETIDKFNVPVNVSFPNKTIQNLIDYAKKHDSGNVQSVIRLAVSIFLKKAGY